MMLPTVCFDMTLYLLLVGANFGDGERESCGGYDRACSVGRLDAARGGRDGPAWAFAELTMVMTVTMSAVDMAPPT